jgi:hypothetical protein
MKLGKRSEAPSTMGLSGSDTTERNKTRHEEKISSSGFLFSPPSIKGTL